MINYPKSLLKINTKHSILKNIYLNFIKEGVKNKDIIFATGYKPELIKKEIGSKVNFIHNKKYASTNMVYTLMNAVKKIDDDIIITYSDIVYDINNIKKIINTKSKFITFIVPALIDSSGQKVRFFNTFLIIIELNENNEIALKQILIIIIDNNFKL